MESLRERGVGRSVGLAVGLSGARSAGRATCSRTIESIFFLIVEPVPWFCFGLVRGGPLGMLEGQKQQNTPNTEC